VSSFSLDCSAPRSRRRERSGERSRHLGPCAAPCRTQARSRPAESSHGRIVRLRAQGRLSIRALVELREVLTEANHAGVLTRAEGMSQEEAQILAVEYRPRPIPRDVVRAVPMPPGPLAVVPTGPTGTNAPPRPPECVEPLAAVAVVPAETDTPPRPPECVEPLAAVAVVPAE
jgi:hypothetical protein